ncbi:MAG TPA: hypothetical protein VGP63_18725 [Planctomycetaceae bacterium]|jgi:hypothetical protein|nr:hypothetical protein [Planctomycetaceae bacterium]
MKLARLIFGAAGIYGLVVIGPMYFLEDRIGRDTPPATTHPEFFYGFVGLGIAWQVAFLCVALDPLRYRLLILPSMLEKFSFAIAVAILVFKDRAPASVAAFAGIDLILGILFVIAYLKTAGPRLEHASRSSA